jgi:hypothetical protein
MRLTTLSSALICVTLLAQQQVSKVALTESRHAVRAFTPSGEMLLPLVRTHLKLQTDSGVSQRGDMIAVQDPQTRHYFWRYTPVRDAGDTKSLLNALDVGTFAIYSAPAGIVEFEILGALYVRENLGSADSVDAAQTAAIQQLERRPRLSVGNAYAQGLKEAIFLGEGDQGFRCPDPPTSAMCPPMLVKIVAVSHEGDNWRVVIRGNWDQEMTLDQEFNVTKIFRLPISSSSPEPKPVLR